MTVHGSSSGAHSTEDPTFGGWGGRHKSSKGQYYTEAGGDGDADKSLRSKLARFLAIHAESIPASCYPPGDVSLLRSFIGAVVFGSLLAGVPSCTIDFDAPFNETGWYGVADAGGDVPADQHADVEGDDSDAPAKEAGEAGLCDDGVRNGDESDVDCGGRCEACPVGAACRASSDCASEQCVDAVCCESACLGACRACSEGRTGEADGTCANVLAGSDPDDECSGGYDCRDGSCESCVDGLQNGDETWIDCGGDCSPCGEICTNGIDDDGNNLVDCEDPLCSSFTCAPATPSGWDGPVWLYAGGGPTPSCPTGAPVVAGGLDVSPVSPATCTGCSCDSPLGQSCAPPAVELFDPSTCTGIPAETVNQPSPGVCENVVDTVQYDSARIVAQPPAGGSCAAAGGLADVDPFAWPQPAMVCELNTALGEGCGDAAACVPLPPSLWVPQICFHRPGSTSCPGIGYDRYTVFSSWTDSRGCSTCECSSPTGGTCNDVVTVYGPEGCAGNGTQLPNDGTCQLLTGSTYYESLRYTPGVPSGASCTPSGGEPIGTVNPTGSTTVCCKR